MVGVASVLGGCKSGHTGAENAATTTVDTSEVTSTAPLDPSPGGVPAAPKTNTTATTVASSSGIPGSTVGPGSSVAGPSPTAAGSPGACTTSGLQVVPAAANDQSGTRVQSFTLTNTTTQPCSMTGYPKVAPYRGGTGGGGGSSVQALLQPIPATDGPIGGPARLVTVNPGQAAVFFLLLGTGGGACQVADGITFDTPISSMFVLISFQFRFCGPNVYESVIFPAGTPGRLGS